MLTTTTVATAGWAATHPAAMVAVHTAITAACRDPSDAERALLGVASAANDAAQAVLNLGYAAWYRDTHYLGQSGTAAVSIPVHAADAAVYGLSALVHVIPKSDYLLPIGWAWGRLRGHNKKQS